MGTFDEMFAEEASRGALGGASQTPTIPPRGVGCWVYPYPYLFNATLAFPCFRFLASILTHAAAPALEDNIYIYIYIVFGSLFQRNKFTREGCLFVSILPSGNMQMFPSPSDDCSRSSSINPPKPRRFCSKNKHFFAPSLVQKEVLRPHQQISFSSGPKIKSKTERLPSRTALSLFFAG